MSTISFYNNWEEATLINRDNRFVMRLNLHGKEVFAYVPNTGRMEEFLYTGSTFYITNTPTPKFDYKVIATKYQDKIVFLDTIKVNDIFHRLLIGNYIKDFENPAKIEREKTVGNSRFDFLLTKQNGSLIYIEVKSCTLIHNKIAMFPDAPTQRGVKHIKKLNQIAGDNLECYVYFLITNYNAESFCPNFHVDPEYARVFTNSNNVHFRAGALNLIDPVTIDLSSIKNISIDYDKLQKHCGNKGSYLLVIENQKEQSVDIGKLGTRQLAKGFYVYVGSAMGGLDQRLKRHRSKSKKKHYHIDYILSGNMKIKKEYQIQSTQRLESKISKRVSEVCDYSIFGFGSSDTKDDSHLFYFKNNPVKQESFYSIILDFRVDKFLFE